MSIRLSGTWRPRVARAIDSAVRWRLGLIEMTGPISAQPEPVDVAGFWRDSRVDHPAAIRATLLRADRRCRLVDLEGDSSGPGQHAGSRRFRGRAALHPEGSDTTVLLLHGFAAPGPFYENHHARLLLRRGVNAARLELPFHMSRRVPGRGPGGGFFSADPAHTRAVLRQATEDAAAVVAWARREVGPRVVVLGFSLGGLVGCLLAATVPVDAVVAVTPPCELADTVLERSPRRTRERLGLLDDGGGPWGADADAARAHLEAALAPVTPARLRPVTPPGRIAVIAADQDQIVGRDPVHRLSRAWGCELWEYRQGHITVMTARGITARLHDRVLDRGERWHRRALAGAECWRGGSPPENGASAPGEIEDTVAGVALAG